MYQEGIEKNNGHYSKLYEKLAGLLVNHESTANKPFNYRSERIDVFMHNYNDSHVVSPWPCIVDESFLNKMKDMVRSFPAIFFKALKILHSRGRDNFCDYLNVPPIIFEFFAQYELNANDIPIRYDAIVEQGDFKLLELNCGASLGGWQMDWLQREVLSSLQDFSDSKDWNLRHHPVCESLFKWLIQSINRKKGDSATGNILFFVPGIAEDELEKMQRAFRGVYENVRPSYFAKGDVFFMANIDDLDVTVDGYIRFDGMEMDTLMLSIENSEDMSEKLYNHIQAASSLGHFYHPDDANHTLMGNKLIFALLHEDFVQQEMTAEEISLINRHVPWTAKVGSESVIWQGERYQVSDLVVLKKEQLVLKKSHSAQGFDVVVGRSSTQEEWEEVVNSQLDNDWLYQAYCAPDLVVSADSIEGAGAFRMVWGVFSLGGTYGGSFLRGVRDKSTSSVINSANGATEFLVFEEQKLKNKVTL
ncbi:hypothetical protein [Pleionea sp. CnH1-48]|uniref:hypothetical protein n=1 Tax=Pleionea sp. CnH1-48 TaxID=2954494 RepID=UPI002096C5EE|nr:hypothetical protein [Pleionea sp. CnH1-48]MCO7226823.1 hypothetical protein [Pleionea sp. CnH1-48]